jgi:sulfite exporter TauE/SafE
MIELVLPVIGAALVGSLHCTSMCGGLVAFGTAGTERSLPARVAALGSYNGMRGLGYVALGTIAGALGSTLDHAGLRIGVSRAAGAVAAVVMIAWGLLRLLSALHVVSAPSASKSSVHVPISRLLGKLKERPPALRSALVGGCTALLPCGFLHAFLVVASGTGSAARGALVMTAFWLGTLPAVVGLGIGVNALLVPLRRHASIVGAVLLVCFGLSNLFERWSPPFVTVLRTELRKTP